MSLCSDSNSLLSVFGWWWVCLVGLDAQGLRPPKSYSHRWQGMKMMLTIGTRMYTELPKFFTFPPLKLNGGNGRRSGFLLGAWVLVVNFSEVNSLLNFGRVIEWIRIIIFESFRWCRNLCVVLNVRIPDVDFVRFLFFGWTLSTSDAGLRWLKMLVIHPARCQVWWFLLSAFARSCLHMHPQILA